MQISKARRTGTKQCGRCGGSGEFGQNEITAREIVAQGGQVGGIAVCWRCGGTGLEATGFEGQNVNAHVMRSSERRGSRAGERRGTIDLVAVITTHETPKRVGRHGVRAVQEIVTAVRVVGRMVDGATFDKTIRTAGMDTPSLLAFEEKQLELSRRVRAGLGVSPLDMISEAEEAVLLAELGVA